MQFLGTPKKILEFPGFDPTCAFLTVHLCLVHHGAVFSPVAQVASEGIGVPQDVWFFVFFFAVFCFASPYRVRRDLLFGSLVSEVYNKVDHLGFWPFAAHPRNGGGIFI